MLQRLGPQMRRAAATVAVTDATFGRQGRVPGPSRRSKGGGPRLTWWQQLSDDRRAIRLAQYEQVVSLHEKGITQRGIAAQMSMSVQTVRKFVRAGVFPERARKARGPTPLDGVVVLFVQIGALSPETQHPCDFPGDASAPKGRSH